MGDRTRILSPLLPLINIDEVYRSVIGLLPWISQFVIHGHGRTSVKKFVHSMSFIGCFLC